MYNGEGMQAGWKNGLHLAHEWHNVHRRQRARIVCARAEVMAARAVLRRRQEMPDCEIECRAVDGIVDVGVGVVDGAVDDAAIVEGVVGVSVVSCLLWLPGGTHFCGVHVCSP